MREILRHHLRRPGMAALIVLTLALGIGATSAVVTLVVDVLVRPLPFPGAERLILAWELKAQEPDRRIVSYPNLRDWQERAHGFAALAGSLDARPTLRLGDDALRVHAIQVTPEFFDVLGIAAAEGRLLGPADFAGDAPAVAVASWEFWQRRMGGDPAAIGAALDLDGDPVTLVGVLPRGAVLTEPLARGTVDFITALDDSAPWFTRGNRMFRVIGRLRPGIAWPEARDELTTLAGTLAEEYPDADAGWTAAALPLRTAMVGDVRRPLWVLLGAAALVLLVACFNVANLLAVQMVGRRRELALRAALGARRGDLLVQLWAESVPLVLLGAAGGFVLAQAILRAFTPMLPAAVGWILEAPTGATTLAATSLAALVTVALIQVLPALEISGASVAAALAERTAGAGESRRSHASKQAILVGELALSLVLLIGATLLIRSFQRLSSVELGFDDSDLLAVQLQLPLTKYNRGPASRPLVDGLLAELARDPRVVSAAVVNHLPLDGGSHLANLHRPGEERLDWKVDLRGMSLDYFATLRIPLVAGRGFSANDFERLAPIVVLNETAARRLWPDSEAVGRLVVVEWGKAPAPRQVVGVVADVRHEAIAAPAGPQAYLPYPELPVWELDLAVRTRGEPLRLAGEVKAMVRRADPDVLVVESTTMAAVVDRNLARPRQYSELLAGFAAVGLVLAMLGIYGVTSFVVSTRTRELGVRLALGAAHRDLLTGLMARSARVVALGTALGIVGALLLTRSLQALLYEVDALDVATFSLAPAGLAALALLATYLPARRALAIDPAAALKLHDT